MKKSISKIEFEARADFAEAHLWKSEDDDDKGFLSVSIDDPWPGFTSSKDVRKLGRKLIAWADRMKKRGQ